MTDISLGVSVTRSLLGFPTLHINDQLNYKITPTFLGGQVTWQRNTAASAYMDGEVTINRKRTNVQENVVIEVFAGAAGTTAQLQANVDTLIKAFCQDNYVMTVVVNGITHQYFCEAADYAVTWAGNRYVAKQLQVSLTVPRRPVPKAGVV